MHLRTPMLWMLAVMLLPGNSKVNANSYEWIALKKLPAPGEVVAFANRPPWGPTGTLSRAEVMTFLSKGTLQLDPVYDVPFTKDRMPGKRFPDSRGVFVTKDGMAFFWRLVHQQVLKLVSSEGRMCYVSLPAPGIADTEKAKPSDAESHKKMKPPEAEDIRWFFNDEGPPTGGSVRQPEAVVLKLLRKGKPIRCAGVVDEFAIQERAWITLPPEQAEITRKWSPGLMRGDAVQIGPMHMDTQVQGIVVAAKGKIFYWEQWGDNLLALRDDAGGMCVLQTAP